MIIRQKTKPKKSLASRNHWLQCEKGSIIFLIKFIIILLIQFAMNAHQLKASCLGEAILLKSLIGIEFFDKYLKKEAKEKSFVENQKKEFKKKLETHLKQRIELTQELIFEPQNNPIYLTQDDYDAYFSDN